MPTRLVSNGLSGPGAQSFLSALDLRKVPPEIEEKASRPRPERTTSGTGAGAGATGRGGSQLQDGGLPLLRRLPEPASFSFKRHDSLQLQKSSAEN